MSYVNKLKYMIIPMNTFNIIRGCAGCGYKQTFLCKGNFRVNANGSFLDVWLIYGCKKCGHTYNLPIYERIKADKIPKPEYQRFIENDEKTVFRYGTDKSVFIKSHAEIDWNTVEYRIVPINENKLEFSKKPILIELYNFCDIPARGDKIASDILQISRSKVTRLINEGLLSVKIIKEQERKQDDD